MRIAHAKWFVEDLAQHEADWAFLGDPRTLTMLLVASALVAVATVTRWLASGLLAGLTPPLRRGAMSLPWPSSPSSLFPPLSRLTGAMPRVLAVSAGITLPALAARGWLLVPGSDLAGVGGQGALLVAEALVGLWLVSGVRVRLAAAALATLCAILVVTNGPLALLEGAYVPAIALYLALTGGGRELALRRAGLAGRVLAVALGAALIASALTEKLVGPTITLSVLHTYPSLNFLSTIGLSVGETNFVAIMGSVEIVLGLLVATRVGGRIVALLALGPFLITVPIFGPLELIGHLPIYAALIAVATRPVEADTVAGRQVRADPPVGGTPRRQVAVGSPSP